MKNLRVDVILESEVRSTSPVSMKLVLRLAGGILVFALVAGTIFCVGKYKLEQRNLEMLEAEWKKVEPMLKGVQEGKKQFQRHQDIEMEFKGWNASRMLWHEHLMDLRAVMTDTVQITRLQADDQFPVEGNNTLRRTVVILQGRAQGPNPKGIVDDLQRVIKTGPGLSNIVESADVAVKTAPGDKSPHRLFTIAVRYKPGIFK